MIPPSRPQLSDLYTLSQSKLLENHTFHSGTYLYSPYMAVPSPPQRILAHLGQRSKDYRSWLVRGLLGERFWVRFPGVISNHCLDSWWTEGGNILYESTVDLSFFQWDGWVPKLSSKERLNCPLVAQNDYEREIFVAGVHAWHLNKNSPCSRFDKRAVWDELLETILHVGTAHVQCTMVQKHGGWRRWRPRCCGGLFISRLWRSLHSLKRQYCS